ncbi:MAG: DUF393 domain-containing protein [Halorientalis sp.]
MSQFEAVLVYDGECPYCSVAAMALQRLDDVAAVSWYDDAVAPFLEAQFDAEPFAMFLVDATEGRVYGGREAARELGERAGLPDLVSTLVSDNYERIAAAVGSASGRERETADYHEQYELTDAAADRYEELAAAATRGPLADA